MERLWLLFILICISASTYGQTGVITGVISTKDGKPVNAASVKLSGTGLGVMTNDRGFYELPNVPYGNHSLLITSLEIDSLLIPILINNNVLRKKIQVHLKQDIAIDEVFVQGKTAKREIETCGFAVAVIETKEASLRNLTTNELLDRAVGVRVRQNGGVGSSVEYNLNGMSGSTIGIFIDGIEASTYGRSFNLNNIPPAMIERIEVYKGVLPSHLSGNYIGGAINVVLKQGASMNNITAAASYGSFNTYSGDIGINFRHPGSGLTFRGSGYHTHSDNSYITWGSSTTYVDERGAVTRPFRAKRFNNVYYATAGRFELGFTDVKWADVFFLGHNISKSYEEIPHGTTMSTPYVGRFNEANAGVWSLNYNKRNLFIDGLALTVNATKSQRSIYLQDTVTYLYNWNGEKRMIIDDSELKPIRRPYRDRFGQTHYLAQQGLPTMSQTDRDIVNMRSNLAYTPWPGHRVSLNHVYSQTSRDDNNLLQPVDKDLVTTSQTNQNITAFNYEAEFWKRRVKTNAQLKYTGNRNNQRRVDFIYPDGATSPEVYRRDTTMFTDNVGYAFALALKVAPKIYLVTSNENSFVAPTETQLYGEAERNILPNIKLTPERNVNINLGFRTDAFELGKNRISFYASAFWRNGYDKITTETLDADTIANADQANLDFTRFVNLGMTQARGFEAELIYIFDNKLNVALNISKFNNLMKGKYDNVGNPSPYYNQQVANEPFFTINTNTQYRLNNILQKNSTLNVFYSFGYVHEYNIAWGNPDWGVTPTQFVHDVGASYRLPSQRLVISLDAKNIFNAELYDNFKMQKPGRGVYVKLNYTINKFL